MSDATYCYPPDFRVLRNFNVRDQQQLDIIERELVTQRLSETIPLGNFDLVHLRAIHRHLFQDIYVWAGEIHTVEISKDGDQFQLRRFVETGMADVHSRLTERNFSRISKPARSLARPGRSWGMSITCIRSVKATGARK
jgi:cell filamentation protein